MNKTDLVSVSFRLTRENAAKFDVMDKLILISQMGLTKTRYETKGDFGYRAMEEAARNLYRELTADPELKPFIEKLMAGMDYAWLK